MCRAELARHVVFVHVDFSGESERDAEGLLRASMPGWLGARRVRSTLFKTDESSPGPPSIKQERENAPLKSSEVKYLCIVRPSGQC